VHTHVASWTQVTSTGDYSATDSPVDRRSSRFSRARDICGMIFGDTVGTTAESPGSNAAGQRVTYALENRCLMDRAQPPN
jgi:hypothetical protein